MDLRDDRLITMRELSSRLGCHRSTVYALLRHDSRFPRPIQLSAGAVRYSLAELETWLAARPREGAPPRNPAGPIRARASAPENGEHPGTSVEVTAEAT